MNYNDQVFFMSFIDDNKPRVGFNVDLIVIKSIESGCKHPDVYFAYLLSTFIKAFHSEFERTQPDHQKINYEQFTAIIMENLSHYIAKQGDEPWERKIPTTELE